jgi:tetratricopeptide (TPR) repeat protein/CHAT domain-containing protein
MTAPNRPESTLNGSNRHGASRSLAKFLAPCLFFSPLAVTLSENALGSALVRPAQQPAQTPRDAGNKADDRREALLLEPGKAIKRELAGADSHTYQISLSAGQFLKVIVEQQGVDIVAQLSGPGGEQIAEFDGEVRSRGQELAWFVAESEGAYRLTVRPKQKNAPTAGYEIRIEELRDAIGDDYALHAARKLLQDGLKLLGAGKYDEALPYFEGALEIRESRLGPDHYDVSQAINGLATIHYYKGEYSKVEPLYQRALAIREKSLDPEHPAVAASLNNLANIYGDLGAYSKAEPLYQRALAIREKSFGAEHPAVADSLNNLAILYRDIGDYAKAEPLYQRALAIREKSLGPEHPGVAAFLHNLAVLYKDIGDYAKAEPLHQRALAIQEKSLGPGHPDVASSLNSLAILYRNTGDYAKAEALYQRALAIREKSLGPEHPAVATSLNNLAILYSVLGDSAKAEPLQQRVLAIQEKSLGPEHPVVAASLHSLALFYTDMGDYAKAEPLLQRVLAIQEKALGHEHPLFANSIGSLAILYRYGGEYAKAEPLFRRALSILENALGTERHIEVFLNEMAVLYAAKGDFAQAVTVQARANVLGERNLTRNLAIGSERQKLAYLALFSKQTDLTLWLHNQALPHDPQALDLAFTILLHRKGRGLDVMANTIGALRRRATPEDQSLFDKLADTRSQLAALTLKELGTAKPGTYRERFKSLEDKAEELESALGARSPDFRAQARPVTLTAVQSALPAGSALIEFAVYTPLDPRNDKNKLPPRYLAYLLAAQGQPKWTDLGEAAPIDRAITSWRQALRDPRRRDVKRLARVVAEKVMWPVLTLAQSGSGETRRLLIAPDGMLNLIPFAALVDRQGRYLVQGYSISYLTSGRDLLRSPVRRPDNQDMVVVADPDYGVEDAVAAESQNVGLQPASFSTWRIRLPGFVAMSRDGGFPFGLPQSANSNFNNQARIYFPPLKGTAGEARALKTILPQATVFTGARATEAALKELHSPVILHVATHGFFLRDQKIRLVGARDLVLETEQSVGISNQPIENPLLRSGLALAGVNLRLGRADQGDDGVLTALEAAGLDLWGTKLVVLSACDTGVGEVKNGEGVFGLRRALSLAGSETQVMSLWPVSDLGARDLMTEYYKGLRRGEGRGDGLRRVQLAMIKGKGRRHPFYWASFIQSGEWANLEGKR